jgi:hypothetical protein
MGKVYNGGFTASTGFRRTDTSPLDDSEQVEFLSDLPLIEKPYRLMRVGVLETERYYLWNGLDISDLSNWIQVGNEKSNSLTSTSEDTVATSLAIKNLKDLLDAEVNNRTTEDGALQDAIDNILLILSSDNTLLDSLQEVVDFITVNKDLLDSLSIGNIAGLQTALDSKASLNGDPLEKFEVADATLSTEAINKGQLDAESTSLQNQISSVSSDLDQEVLDRGAAIDSVTSQITQEVTDRETAITAVETQISQESSDRASAITALEAQVVSELDLKQGILIADDSLYIDSEGYISSNLTDFTDTFIYDGTSSTFTTSFKVVKFNYIYYNNIPLDSISYVYTHPNQLEITFPLEVGDVFSVNYNHFVIEPIYE